MQRAIYFLPVVDSDRQAGGRQGAEPARRYMADTGVFVEDSQPGRQGKAEESHEEGGEVKSWTGIDGGMLKMFFALTSDGDELSKKAAQVGIATLSPSRRVTFLRVAKTLVEWFEEIEGEESAHRREKKPAVKNAKKKPSAKKATKKGAK